jgi:hypothetical protein
LSLASLLAEALSTISCGWQEGKREDKPKQLAGLAGSTWATVTNRGSLLQ